MPLSPYSWKDAGWDTSPPRPAPSKRALEEMEAGRRTQLINGWINEGKVMYDAHPHQYRTRGGAVFDAEGGGCPSDGLIARIALALEAGA